MANHPTRDTRILKLGSSQSLRSKQPDALPALETSAEGIAKEKAAKAGVAKEGYTVVGTEAAFTLLPRTSLDGLRHAFTQKKPSDHPHDACKSFLLKNGRRFISYHWSGFIMGTLLVYLQEKRKIDLLKSEFDDLAFFLTKVRKTSNFILTSTHKKAYFDQLSVSEYSISELRSYFEAFNQRKNEHAGKAMLDGIALIRANLFYVTWESVVLLSIG